MIRSYAVRPLNSAIPGALAELLRDAPLSPGKVSFAWRAAVGPALSPDLKAKLESVRCLKRTSDAIRRPQRPLTTEAS